MSDSMKPLLQEDADEFERRLLGSVDPEEPPAGARDRAMAALGLSAMAPAGDAGTPSTTGGPATGFFATKWLVPLCLIAAGGVAITTTWTSDVAPGSALEKRGALADNPAAGARESEESLAPPAPSPPSSVVETAALPSITPNALPDAPTTREAATVGARRAPERARAFEAPRDHAAADALARETLLVDDARRAVAKGEPTRALALLDEYDRDFPSGAFLLDAGVLRIEALERAGRSADAERLAREFLARHPAGSYARRVRTVLGRMASVTGAPTKGAPMKEPVQ